MPSTNKTSLGLSQYIPDDKPKYLTDHNNDMSIIDDNIVETKSTANNALLQANATHEEFTAIDIRVTTAENKIVTLETNDTSINEDITNMKTNISNNTTLGNTALSTANSAQSKANEADELANANNFSILNMKGITIFENSAGSTKQDITLDYDTSQFNYIEIHTKSPSYDDTYPDNITIHRLECIQNNNFYIESGVVVNDTDRLIQKHFAEYKINNNKLLHKYSGYYNIQLNNNPFVTMTGEGPKIIKVVGIK